MKDVVVIPAYEPDETLVGLAADLHEKGLGVLIVDDGSSIPFDEIFKKASKYAVVIHNNKNLGKGAALKNGFKEVLSHFPDCEHLITADADGQHTVKDILRVRDELNRGAKFVLTERKFSDDMPARSRFGNNLSRWIYTTLTGHYFKDNQSGLRGFSVNNIEWLLKVKGNKYDYEMNMLYYADKQRIAITTLPIEALYINGNVSSHFNPIKDTIMIYKQLFASAWVSFAMLVLAETLMLIASIIYKNTYMFITVPSVGAEVAVLNMLFNRLIAFRNVRYGDGARAIIYIISRYAAYTAGCYMVLSFINIPLIIVFNFVALACIPLEYLVHKLLRFSKYQDIHLQ